MSIPRSRPKSFSYVALILLLGATVPALADDDGGRPIGHKVEITPFVSYFFEGDYDTYYDDFSLTETAIDEGEGYGLMASFRIHRNFQIELLYSRQETDLSIDEPFFFDNHGFPDSVTVPVDLQYFQAGIAFTWRRGQIEPFVDLTLGATKFDVDDPASDDSTELSAGIGGGVKVFFADHVGLRFQGRVLSTDTDERDVHCDSHGGHTYCYRYDDTYLTQPEVSLGLIFAF